MASSNNYSSGAKKRKSLEDEETQAKSRGPSIQADPDPPTETTQPELSSHFHVSPTTGPSTQAEPETEPHPTEAPVEASQAPPPDPAASQAPPPDPTASQAPPPDPAASQAPPPDPVDWPSVLSDAVRADFVRRGPLQIKFDYTFPKREDGRACHHYYFFRTLVNGEKMRRSWLTYSPKSNALFCFCCKLFSLNQDNLVKGGVSDWKTAPSILRTHESTPEHTKHLVAWKELELHLKKGETIDMQEISLTEAEKRRWRDVLTRLVAIIQSLAQRNIALSGSSDTLYQPNNGNFLKEVELLAKFDPVIQQHIARVQSAVDYHPHYLGKTVQNELIAAMSGRVMEEIVTEIKAAKYFSIILDCTPDLSHQEQMSAIIRTVVFNDMPEIKEHFIGFLVADESTGESLANLILKKLNEHNIPFGDCRGQSYDNGASMRGGNKGVQARLLEVNPRAFFVPCGAHTLNLVVSDAAKASSDAMNYFGYLRKIYCLFSASVQRWEILKKHVEISVKAWADPRWESRIKSVEALRYQPAEVREALLEVRDKATDGNIRIEAQSLAEEVGSYRFSICSVVWYDILANIQHVSKLMQSSEMQLDVAVDLLRKTQRFLADYSVTGFAAAQATAKEICDEMNVDAALKQKRLRSTKQQFAYATCDEPFTDALKRLEVTFFNTVVDAAKLTIEERFVCLSEVKDMFSVLLNFTNLTHDELSTQCETLSAALTTNRDRDINGSELAFEIKNLPQLPSPNMTLLGLLSFIHTQHLKELYPNLCIALRIALTLPVTVASAETSFSKLKRIKTYLRSTMSQECLTGLAILNVNHEICERISYNDVINDFAAKKSRAVKI